MKIIHEITECREFIQQASQTGKVGLVPTMGSLHDGHMSLVQHAREDCRTVALTIFVNPTQFGPNEDLDTYPRTPDEDIATCQKHGVDVIFMPSPKAMYPGGDLTTVHVDRLSSHLCGASRPGHFDGVSTVVAKLFGIAPAHRAYFGEKDFQQLAIIRRMVSNLNMPIEIVGCPIVREADGLALSSRNRYLSPQQRKNATVLHQCMNEALEQVHKGESNCATLIELMTGRIRNTPEANIDYVEIVDSEDICPIETIQKSARICLAVKFGDCRLIDNMAVDPPSGAR